ncbi:MAG: tyrosine--tRNA ligase [Bacteroidales bacterium]|uniref:tyrosine--tRNA ligase n=1 Tax=Candidatus Cryptobacteroides sp. TaxID=2952915 RepID=UPI002A74F092|nr:tyrosine--tRNA ligase [Candidatus Cryptobacteroides sp.]MCI6526193.1 tyrosine--tRNA ligase [Bacteroidales bacterium]MDD7135636.1 tyrosine--tRNA ligase [Bacteroidales bacterium]MDD7235464.1 tyrosine--tRNA ligase [Bacteroidales bacterium]MDD7623857.1 tyrosine--tRNA ligase [Bacteroidales bacterium]MDY2701932.1 tyrosine--tRNA ligase [Candidatus Cryptobacteroides sp.]
MKNFVEELKWRGMIHDITPGAEEELMKGPAAAYVGIDPTGDSLHIGHLVSVMILKHFQNCGHKPYALVGGATGMIGDPSMKSAERNLLDEETLGHNVECIKAQLGRFLDFDSDSPNAAKLVNNYDWMKDYTFINFARDIGKLITVNYMMSKDSVKKRLSRDSSEGMSFTEFSYQLLQGYDFLYLYEHEGVRLQLGGADQWGNITTGTELIRRTLGEQAFALTCPLITKSDGTKFGKTEKGNIWLDPKKTSPYEFYQFWLNVADDDAEKYIKIFTMLDRETIESAIEEHRQDPGRRSLQQLLAKEVTIMIHGETEYANALAASKMLFGNSTSEELRKLDEKTFLAVFNGVPTFDVPKSELPCNILDFLAVKTGVFPSKGEARKMTAGGGVSINKDKVTDINYEVSEKDIMDGKYILAQKGKKNYFIINVI